MASTSPTGSAGSAPSSPSLPPASPESTAAPTLSPASGTTTDRPEEAAPQPSSPAGVVREEENITVPDSPASPQPSSPEAVVAEEEDIAVPDSPASPTPDDDELAVKNEPEPEPYQAPVPVPVPVPQTTATKTEAPPVSPPSRIGGRPVEPATKLYLERQELKRQQLPPVELGFLERGAAANLHNRYFPSKMGGKPAWLELDNIPTIDQVRCRQCRKPMVMLCQLYADQADVEHAFHRTVYVFICNTGACWLHKLDLNETGLTEVSQMSEGELSDGAEEAERGAVRAGRVPVDVKKDNLYRPVVVLRSQLARRNPFYDYEPPAQANLGPIPARVNLCEVCGIRGPATCSRCKSAFYCCREHQKLHWGQGHRTVCVDKGEAQGVNFGLEELEIIIEDEYDEVEPKSAPQKRQKNEELERVIRETALEEHIRAMINYAPTSAEETEEQAERRRQQIAVDLRAAQVNASDPATKELCDKELERFARAEQDAVFAKFQKRIAHKPQQVLRYQRHEAARPLWIAAADQLAAEDVPRCELCGGLRSFEFQVMPQMIYYAHADRDVDFGVICVYTCKSSCFTGVGYATEFGYVQDVAPDVEHEVDEVVVQ